VRLRIWIEDEPLSPDADGIPPIYLSAELKVEAPLPILRTIVLAWLNDARLQDGPGPRAGLAASMEGEPYPTQRR